MRWEAIICNMTSPKQSTKNKKVKDPKIKVFEAFAGYGGASFALKRAKIPHQTIGFSEFDKFAVELYEANHPDVPGYGDITLSLIHI